MHATVALDEMVAVEEFDHICQGPGETTIVDLVRGHHELRLREGLHVAAGGQIDQPPPLAANRHAGISIKQCYSAADTHAENRYEADPQEKIVQASRVTSERLM